MLRPKQIDLLTIQGNVSSMTADWKMQQDSWVMHYLNQEDKKMQASSSKVRKWDNPWSEEIQDKSEICEMMHFHGLKNFYL